MDHTVEAAELREPDRVVGVGEDEHAGAQRREQRRDLRGIRQTGEEHPLSLIHI